MAISKRDEFRHERKTITFTGGTALGAVGAVPLWTVTGQILVEKLIAWCTVNVASAGGGSLALGVTSNTSLFIAATTATDIDANEHWTAAAPASRSIAIPAALQNVLVGNENILATVAAAGIESGSITFDLHWVPISDAFAVS